MKRDKDYISPTDFGAVGDGVSDCTEAFITALKMKGRICVPFGKYLISETLPIDSDTELVFENGAALFPFGGGMNAPLVSNSSPLSGNRNITVSGGIFSKNTAVCEDFSPIFRFENVTGLEISSVHFMNQTAACLEAEKTENFIFKNIRFSSACLAPHCDGIRILGSKHGKIQELRAINEGMCTGFMVCLSSSSGEISDIRIEDVCAESCGGFINFLSSENSISGISAGKIFGGAKCALNIDGKNGLISDIEVCDLELYSLSCDKKPLISVSGNADGVTVTNLHRPGLLDEKPLCPTAFIKDSDGCRIIISGLSPECALSALENSSAKHSSLDFSDKLHSYECVSDKSSIITLPCGGFSRLSANKQKQRT